MAVFLIRQPKEVGRLWRTVGGLILLAFSLGGLVPSLPLVASQGDGEVFDALRVTIWYTVLTVPVQLILGLAVALLLTRRVRGRQAFRVMVSAEDFSDVLTM